MGNRLRKWWTGKRAIDEGSLLATTCGWRRLPGDDLLGDMHKGGFRYADKAFTLWRRSEEVNPK